MQRTIFTTQAFAVTQRLQFQTALQTLLQTEPRHDMPDDANQSPIASCPPILWREENTRKKEGRRQKLHSARLCKNCCCRPGIQSIRGVCKLMSFREDKGKVPDTLSKEWHGLHQHEPNWACGCLQINKSKLLAVVVLMFFPTLLFLWPANCFWLID